MSATSTALAQLLYQPHYISPDDNDNDDGNENDLLIYLYFQVQVLQTLWQCKCNKSKLQKRKVYFPIIYALEKASIKVKCFWCWRKLVLV